MIADFFYIIKYYLLDIFFPNKCIICGKVSDYICKNCLKDLNYLSYDKCVFCNSSCLFGICEDCSKKLAIDGIFCLFKYKKIKKVIKNMKYEGFYDICRFFGEILSYLFIKNGIISCIKSDYLIITSVPMHKNRIKERGYNQAEKIAKVFSYKTNIPFYSNLLFRIKNTVKQATLSEKDRENNLKDAFACNKFLKFKEDINDISVILIDDVCTTGNTISECSLCLKNFGFNYVYVITIAKA